MSKRPPSPPPEIAGFQYLSVIGSGGFSDVFLYQQRRPRRRVAVKVLLNEWSSPAQRAAFDAEADLMATLSTHPSIVTMYEANVAADGRPYLAMEYCSKPSLGARYRQERFSVAEALRIGVQIAGAVETAHRAGILHRDIKPANILVTEYGHPALTDFGISSTIDDAGLAEGMSVPWSPPESFEDPPSSSVLTDVWALGATIYTLLARRSPFEVPGGSNSSSALISRIQSQDLVPTGRSDVPASLERVLATAMAKSTASRYQTVLDLARGLQQVQNELSFSVTPIDLLEEVDQDDQDGDDDGGTRMRRFAPPAEVPHAQGGASAFGVGHTGTGPTDVIGGGQPRPGDVFRIGGTPARDRVPSVGTSFQSVTVPPPVHTGPAPIPLHTQTGAAPARPAPIAQPSIPTQGTGAVPLRSVERPPIRPVERPGAPTPTRPVEVVPAPVEVSARPRATTAGERGAAPWHAAAPEGGTSSARPAARAGDPAPARPARPRWLWPVVGVAVVALAAVTTFVLWPKECTTDCEGDPFADVPTVTGLAGTWRPEFGTVDFTWDSVDGVDGDAAAYAYRQTAPTIGASQDYTETLKAAASLSVAEGEQVCIDVVVQTKDGRQSPAPAELCVEAGS